MRLHPIGVVRSPVLEPLEEGWGKVLSTLELDPALAPGLDGVEEFTHVGVLFWLHLARFRMLKAPSERARSRTLNFTVC